MGHCVSPGRWAGGSGGERQRKCSRAGGKVGVTSGAPVSLLCASADFFEEENILSLDTQGAVLTGQCPW